MTDVDPDVPPADPVTPPADPPADPAPPAAPPAPADDATVLQEIAAMATELGISPGQLKGRLDASRKWEQRAKAADQQAEQARLAALSDQERAIEEAKAAARQEGRDEAVLDIAAARIEAQLAPIVGAEKAAEIIGDLNLANYVTDGKVDTDKVSTLRSRYEGLIGQRPPGSADGGPRGGAKTDPTLDEQIAAAQKAGDVKAFISLQNRKLAASAGAT